MGSLNDYHLIWSLLEADASVRIVEERLYMKRDHDGARLTIQPVEQCRKNLSRILDVHGVTGRRKRRLLHEHGQWFGRPTQEAAEVREHRTFPRLHEIWKRVVYGPLD